MFRLFILLLWFGWQSAFSQNPASTLAGKIICLDAGHGGTAQTDSYRVGPSGEREEWINLRVAKLLRQLLEEKGARVLMTRTADDNISFDDRIRLALGHQADVFLSVHHNATADPAVNFPIIYFHGNASENAASVALGTHIARALAKELYGGKTPVSLVSDHTIFPTAGTRVLRGTYGIPGVIAEASFFTHPAEEERLKQEAHNRREARAYVAALEAFFKEEHPAIAPKNSIISVPPFTAFQEAERMSEIARRWYQDFREGQKRMKQRDTTVLRQAYDLFTRSARSFPDSYVAAECHRNRAVLLKKLGKPEEALIEEKRAREFYVQIQ
jgi:N-acetylmuramoyl-L-alanine amidase